jgi:hypothetical protein
VCCEGHYLCDACVAGLSAALSTTTANKPKSNDHFSIEEFDALFGGRVENTLRHTVPRAPSIVAAIRGRITKQKPPIPIATMPRTTSAHDDDRIPPAPSIVDLIR